MQAKQVLSWLITTESPPAARIPIGKGREALAFHIPVDDKNTVADDAPTAGNDSNKKWCRQRQQFVL